jgi:hypothetical protein
MGVGEYRKIDNMPFFVRNIVGIALLVGLFFAVGCASNPAATKTSPFPWQKAEKESRKTSSSPMDEFMAQPRATSLLTR